LCHETRSLRERHLLPAALYKMARDPSRESRSGRWRASSCDFPASCWAVPLPGVWATIFWSWRTLRPQPVREVRICDAASSHVAGGTRKARGAPGSVAGWAC